MRHRIAHGEIAHERVDDEVIAVDLTTGAYYSLRGAGADTWDLLVGGADEAEVVATLRARYEIIGGDVEADVDAFVRDLLAAGLLAGDDAVSEATRPPLPTLASGTTYTRPTLEAYDDMQGLLLLDPIHEVDEAGWPVIPVAPTD
ncbi:MAG TPA: PqqD family protein [Ilumatobacteraceae bacterium]|nr:PqqD family protein [Ilumatobacteraceae bacterium]